MLVGVAVQAASTSVGMFISARVISLFPFTMLVFSQSHQWFLSWLRAYLLHERVSSSANRALVSNPGKEICKLFSSLRNDSTTTARENHVIVQYQLVPRQYYIGMGTSCLSLSSRNFPIIPPSRSVTAPTPMHKEACGRGASPVLYKPSRPSRKCVVYGVFQHPPDWVHRGI